MKLRYSDHKVGLVIEAALSPRLVKSIKDEMEVIYD